MIAQIEYIFLQIAQCEKYSFYFNSVSPFLTWDFWNVKKYIMFNKLIHLYRFKLPTGVLSVAKGLNFSTFNSFIKTDTKSVSTC